MLQKGLLYVLFTGCAILAVAVYAYQRPYYNWDMFPYMALTLASPEKTFEEVHRLTYQEARQQMRPADFEAIASRQPLLRDDPAAFQSILPYFTIKPGYVLITRMLYRTGLNALSSTVVPSIIGYCLLGALSFWWFQRSIPVAWAAVATLLFMAAPFMLAISRYSSPDMLAAALVLAGALLIADARTMMGIVLGSLSIFMRPDSVIFMEVLVITACLTRALSWRAGFLISFLLASLTIWILNGFSLIPEYLFTGPDYSPTWNFNSIRTHYGQSLSNGLRTILHSYLGLFLFLGTAGLIMKKLSGMLHPRDFWSILPLGLMASLLPRYLLHPIIEDRFLIALYLLLFISFAASLRDYTVYHGHFLPREKT